VSLLSDIEAQEKPKGSPCSIPAIEAVLSPEDAADLEAALASPEISGTAIARALDGRGIKVSSSTIQRHRRRECRCPA
jgi:hypothetical protein